MNLADLLVSKGYDLKAIIVLRHRPTEPRLRKTLPWLAADKPDDFNAYQQSQQGGLERAMAKLEGGGYVASFIGLDPARAHFVGLYSIDSSTPVTHAELMAIPANKRLADLGSRIGEVDRERTLWFQLRRVDFYPDWLGKLVIEWPPPERSWWRRAHKNQFPVVAIHPDSLFSAAMPEWESLELSWEELQVLPKSWKARLAEWRGIYLIYDESDRMSYVGSAYGKSNLLGRWMNYAKSGHGDNRLLRKRDPTHFRFSILQRVSPDMDSTQVIQLESSWKQRLHTRHPLGLNDN